MTSGNYHAFGMGMPGRTWSGTADEYRYDFNGKESDQETSSGALDFGMREYDDRLGRFFNRDPFTKYMTNKTPYGFAGDNPILFIDAGGGYQVIPYLSGVTGDKLKALQKVARSVSNMAHVNNGNNPFVAQFMARSGCSWVQAMQTLSYGSGPVLIVSKNTNVVPGQGRYYNNPVPPNDCPECENFIFINDNLISGMVKGVEGFSQGSLESEILLILSLWHEGIHYADYVVDGVPTPRLPFLNWDAGDLGEFNLFGFFATLTNLENNWKDNITPESTNPYDITSRSNMKKFKLLANGDFLVKSIFVNSKGYSIDVKPVAQALRSFGQKIGQAFSIIGQKIKGLFDGTHKLYNLRTIKPKKGN